MGWEVIVDNGALDEFIALASLRKAIFETGLLLGTFGSDKTVIVRCVPTPAIPEGVGLVTSSWVEQHSKLIKQHLCGGYTVVGVYGWGSGETLKSKLPQLHEYSKKACGNDARAVVKIDSSTNRASFQNATLVHRAVMKKAFRVTCDVPVNITAFIPSRMLTKEHVPDVLKRCVEYFEDQLRSSRLTFDSVSNSVSVFSPVFGKPLILAEPEDTSECTELKITGALSTKSIFVNGESGTAVTQAVVADAVHSFNLRVQLFTETIDQAGPSFAGRNMTLPRRVFSSFGGGLPISDHTLPDDLHEDTEEQWMDLSLHPTEGVEVETMNNVLMVKSSATAASTPTSTVKAAPVTSGPPVQTSLPQPPTRPETRGGGVSPRLLIVILAILFALVSLGVAYLR